MSAGMAAVNKHLINIPYFAVTLEVLVPFNNVDHTGTRSLSPPGTRATLNLSLVVLPKRYMYFNFLPWLGEQMVY